MTETSRPRALTAAPRRPRAAGWRRIWPILPALIFLGIAFVYPVALLLGTSVLDRAGQVTAQHYTRLFQSAVVFQVLLITLKIAGWTALLSMLAGYPVAYLLATIRPARRNLLVVLVLLPFWTSFLVRTFAWIVLLGRNGALNQLLKLLGVADPPSFLYNFTGVMIGMVHALMPLSILTMLAVMEGIDRNLLRAAGTLGARPGAAFWRVHVPLSLPGAAAGGLLVFVTALGFFITPALLGGARETMISQQVIFQIKEALNWGFAGAIAVLLLAVALAVFWLYDRLVGLSTLSGGAAREPGAAGRNPIARAGRWIGGLALEGLSRAGDVLGGAFDRLVPLRPDRPRPRIGRAVLWAAGLPIIGFLAVPALFIVPVSFTNAGFLSWPPAGFSLRWYESVLGNPLWISAASRSLAVAAGAGLLGLLLGVPAAFYLVRHARFGRTALLGFLLSPLIMPHIIIAVALFYLFARIGLVGTTLGLVLGHTVLAVPYVVVTVVAVLKTYDERLDQAASTLGADRLRTLAHVTLPLIRSGLIAAFMFAFIASFDELTIALFVTSGQVTTLPKQMWDDALLRVSPALAAVATMMLVFMTALILLSEHFRRRGPGRP